MLSAALWYYRNFEGQQSLHSLSLCDKMCIRDRVTGAGVQVVMVTGDGKDPAAAIAREIGLVGSRDPECAIMTSDELNRLSDEQVKRILPSLRVVARALPGDKSRLVRVAGEMGLVTGMTGDVYKRQT